MSLRLLELSTAQAQARYERLPQAWRIASLSPAFAAADALRDPRLRCVHLGVEGGTQEWLHSVHLQALADEPKAWGAISPYGYGGPLTPSADPAFLAAAWAAWQAWCVAQGVLAEFCRFHPQAPGTQGFGGTVRENRRTVVLDLAQGPAQAGYNALTRRKITRARRAGVQARWSRAQQDWRQFAHFYRAAMQAMGAAPFYFFGDAYFEALAALPCTRLLVCERAGQWLSAGVYLREEAGAVMEYHLGASSPEGKALGTACLLQDEAARHGAAQGAVWLYLGGGTDTREDNPLLFYKLGFSRSTLPFFIGEAIHDENRYWSVAARHGFDRQHPPARLLLD